MRTTIGRGWALVGVVLLSLVIVACGSGGGGDASDSNAPELGTAESALTANDKTAFDYLLGKGLTSVQAAGVVGNLDQESNMDPAAVQAGGPGRGIAQWSVGGRWDTSTKDNATWFAGTEGKSVSSLGLQLDFIWYELSTFSSYGLTSLEASKTVTSATIAFQNDFEGCGTCDQSKRVAYAEAAYAAYGSDVVAGGGDGGDAGDADAGPSGAPTGDPSSPPETAVAPPAPPGATLDEAPAPPGGDTEPAPSSASCATAPGRASPDGAMLLVALAAIAGLARARRAGRDAVVAAARGRWRHACRASERPRA